MIILSEASDQLVRSASSIDLQKMTEAAKIQGFKVYYIPQDFNICETAHNALYHVPKQTQPTLGIWIGYIPQPEHYAAVYQAALDKNIHLLNTPKQHLIAQEFDQAYPKLLGLTPRSFVLTDVAQCPEVVAMIGLPLFVKGTVQSRKAKGWKACVAYTLEELQALTQQLLSLEARSRGRVIVRQLIKLRYSRTSAQEFPLGREYRVFVYGQTVLGWGYYWEGDDPLKALTADEQQIVLQLALTTAARLEVPYLAVDIGQQEDGQWIVIEVGDAQFSGVSQIPVLQLWHAIREIEPDEA